MDQNLIKGHFFLGLSLLEMEIFDEAIKHLQRGRKEEKLEHQ
jgi:STIP1 homology and U-box containing protein 1